MSDAKTEHERIMAMAEDFAKMAAYGGEEKCEAAYNDLSAAILALCEAAHPAREPGKTRAEVLEALGARLPSAHNLHDSQGYAHGLQEAIALVSQMADTPARDHTTPFVAVDIGAVRRTNAVHRPHNVVIENMLDELEWHRQAREDAEADRAKAVPCNRCGDQGCEACDRIQMRAEFLAQVGYRQNANGRLCEHEVGESLCMWCRPEADCAPIAEFDAAEATAKLVAEESERRRPITMGEAIGAGKSRARLRAGGDSVLVGRQNDVLGPAFVRHHDKAERDRPLAVGDRVQLKSGGPVMDVRGRDVDGGILCQWGVGEAGWFNPDALRMVEP